MFDEIFCKKCKSIKSVSSRDACGEVKLSCGHRIRVGKVMEWKGKYTPDFVCPKCGQVNEYSRWLGKIVCYCGAELSEEEAGLTIKPLWEELRRGTNKR